MTRDEAVEDIQEGLGFRSDLTTAIIRRLKKAQRDEEQAPLLPWFLISEYTFRQATIGEERLTFPDGYIRGVENDALWYYNADADEEEDVWVPLKKGDAEYLRKAYPGTGSPKAYTEMGHYIRLFPTPDDTYQLRHVFYKKDTVLNSNIENLWLEHAPDLLIGVAGKEMAQRLRDAGRMKDNTAVELFTEMEQKARALLFNSTEAKEHANQRYIMGDPD